MSTVGWNKRIIWENKRCKREENREKERRTKTDKHSVSNYKDCNNMNDVISEIKAKWLKVNSLEYPAPLEYGVKDENHDWRL